MKLQEIINYIQTKGQDSIEELDVYLTEGGFDGLQALNLSSSNSGC